MIAPAFVRLIIICKPWSLFQMAKEMNMPELLRHTRKLQQNGIKEIIFKFSKVVSITPPDLTHTVAILVHHPLIAFIFPCDLTCFESRFQNLFSIKAIILFLISSLKDFMLRKLIFKKPSLPYFIQACIFWVFQHFSWFSWFSFLSKHE